MSIRSFLSNFISKAGNISTTDGNQIINPFQIVSGNQHTSNLQPANLIALNNGWVNICNSKNSTTCASVPLKLYYKNSTGKDLQVTQFRKLDRKSVSKLCKSANIILKQEEEIEEIIEHPLLDLFESINDTMNYYDWSELNFEYIGLIGNSYNEIVFENNMPVALNPLLAEYVTPIATGKKQGKIVGYLYKPEDKETRFTPEQILHFAQYSPGNNLIGKGDLERCLSAQERYLYYDAFEKYLGLNNSRPDFAVNYKQKLSEKDLKDLYRQWNKRFGGIKNSGKVVVSQGDMDIKTLSLSPRDLQYQVGREWARQEICGAFGVPKSLVTSDDINLANSISGMNQYLRQTIYPKMVKFCSKINEQLTPKYDPNLFVWFEGNYTEDPKEKYNSSIQAYNAGIISKNEARGIIGMEAVEGGEFEDEVNVVEETDTTTTMIMDE